MGELYEELRPKAFGIAYRMLGSVAEAEDVVQDAFLRLHRELEGGAQIESPEAYLVTVVTRLGIDELRSARARREVYVGEWLPEPILTAEASDPARYAEIAESLSGRARTARDPLARAACSVPAARSLRLSLRTNR